MLVRYTKFPKGEFAHSRFGELERERRLLLRAKQQQVLMGAEQSSPGDETHRTEISSGSSPGLTPTVNVSAASTPDGGPSEQRCADEAFEDPLHACAIQHAGDSSARDDMEEFQQYEQLPAWATTPILPKPPRSNSFSFRSPLKELRAKR